MKSTVLRYAQRRFFVYTGNHMTINTTTTHSMQEILTELKEISAWFDAQEEVDVEVALTKVREGALLVKEGKTLLAGLENQFIELQNDLA